MCSRFETRIPARLWNKSNERILNYKFNNVRSGNLISAQRDYVRRAAILASGGVTLIGPVTKAKIQPLFLLLRSPRLRVSPVS